MSSAEKVKETYVISHVNETNCLLIANLENKYGSDYVVDYKFYNKITENPEFMGQKEFLEMLERDAKRMMRKNGISEATFNLSNLTSGKTFVLRVEEKKKKQQFEMER